MFDLNKIQTESRSVQRELVWAWEHRVCITRPPPSSFLPLSLSRLISSNILSPLRSGIFNPLTLIDMSRFAFTSSFFSIQRRFLSGIRFPDFAIRGPFSLSHLCLGNKRLNPRLWPPMRAGIKLLPSSKCKYKSHCQVKHPRGLKVSPLQRPPSRGLGWIAVLKMSAPRG